MSDLGNEGGFNFKDFDDRKRAAAEAAPPESPTTRAADAVLRDAETELGRQEASLTGGARMVRDVGVNMMRAGTGLFVLALSQQSMEGALFSATVAGLGFLAATGAAMTAEGVGKP